MTDPSKDDSGRGEVSGNEFKGPAAAQTGSSNTQINHYPPPSTTPGGGGREARLTILITAVLFAAGVVGLGALNIVPTSGRDGQSDKAGGPRRPEAPATGSPSHTPSHRPPSPSLPTPTPTGPGSVAPKTDQPSPSPSVTPQPGSITWKGHEELCVDVDENKNFDAQPVQLWDCNHAEGQDWRYESGALKTYTAPERCLDPRYEGEENGTLVQLFECTGREAQRWERTASGKLRNRKSGLCLGFPEKAGGRGVQLRTYNCASDGARVWIHHD